MITVVSPGSQAKLRSPNHPNHRGETKQALHADLSQGHRHLATCRGRERNPDSSKPRWAWGRRGEELPVCETGRTALARTPLSHRAKYRASWEGSPEGIPSIKVEDLRLREGSSWPEVTQHLVAEPDLESGSLRSNAEKSPLV